MTVTATDLTARLEHLREAPTEVGSLALVVRRRAVGERELLDEGVLDEADGLVGDNWLSRATSRAVAAGRHLDAQLTVMSARMVGLLAADASEQALAGDQLYVDLDLSHDNLPAGTRLAIGDSAVIEVTAKPHNGCKKFMSRFGEDATEFVNSEHGQAMRLRGLNARVVCGGIVRPGDTVRRV
ncbi:MAG: MOSC domain-containing protein [Nocardioides sp.]